MESHEGSEEPTIDQARILGKPDRQPAQGENVEFFFVSNQVIQSVQLSEVKLIDISAEKIQHFRLGRAADRVRPECAPGQL